MRLRNHAAWVFLTSIAAFIAGVVVENQYRQPQVAIRSVASDSDGGWAKTVHPVAPRPNGPIDHTVVLDPFVSMAWGQEKNAAVKPAPAAKAAPKRVYARGRVAPKNLPAIKRAAFARNGHLKFPKVTAPKWDCYQLGIVPPIRDQGQCGSCWDFSGSRVATCALIKAGWGKPDGSFFLSEQYTLDCGRNGGCNGDDNTTVLDWAKATGLPTDADYGPYQARSGRCKTGLKLLRIRDWGFADGGQGNGVTSVQQIKDAIAQYGPVGCGIDANVLGDGTGIVSGTGHSIDHDVTITGWDDSKGKAGCWIMDNSWGPGWGITINGLPGRCYIEYGAGDIGTETVWAVADPPTPTAAPAITSVGTATITAGQAFSYQITASNSPSAYGATGLPSGLTVSATTGIISGAIPTGGTFNTTISATNAIGTGSAALTITSIGPVPPGPGPQPSGTTPAITSPLTASATVGQAFTYQITATNAPSAFAATSLPAGLTVSTATGIISGTPTQAGTAAVTVLAANASGLGTATVTLTVSGSTPGAVTIQLTPDQVASVITQSGAVVVTRGMTIGEVMDALAKSKQTPPKPKCCGRVEEKQVAPASDERLRQAEADIAALKRFAVAAMKRLAPAK